MGRIMEFNEDQAIQKAMEVFWKKGYNGASMRELTEAMQINVSSLYRTIGDKQQLFARCISNYVRSRIDEAEANAAGIKSPLKAIISFVNDVVRTILYGSNSCLAIKTTFEIAISDPAVQAILKEDRDFTHRFILNLVNKAIAQKELSASTDAEAVTDYLINAFAGWHESFILHRDPARIKKMAKYLIGQLTS